MVQPELKQELMEWLSELNDSEIVNGIKFIKDSYENNLTEWDALSEQEKLGIKRGFKDIEEGRIVPNDVIKMKYGLDHWLDKRKLKPTIGKLYYEQ